jgi:hypothetical protein
MNWSVPLEFYYVDDTNKGKGTHYKYPIEDVESYIVQASQQASMIYNALKQEGDDIHKASKWFSKSTQWLMMALHRYPVNGSNVVSVIMQKVCWSKTWLRMFRWFLDLLSHGMKQSLLLSMQTTLLLWSTMT